MRLINVNSVLEKYINKAFRLYQDKYEYEVAFKESSSVTFLWDEDENIEKVIIKAFHDTYEGTTEESFQTALELVEVNSKIILLNSK